MLRKGAAARVGTPPTRRSPCPPCAGRTGYLQWLKAILRLGVPLDPLRIREPQQGGAGAAAPRTVLELLKLAEDDYPTITHEEWHLLLKACMQLQAR